MDKQSKQSLSKLVLVFGVLVLLVGVVCVNQYQNINNQPVSNEEVNYAGLYALGLIPNSPELPPTQADKVIGVSSDGTKEMIYSPFGWTYIREVSN